MSFLANAQNEKDEWQEYEIYPVRVNELVHDFGKIKQYNSQKFKFLIINDSIQPLIIKDVTTSCGCTTSSFTKRPIAKGKQAVVKVEFNAAKPGVFSKSAFIAHSFGYKSIHLKIKGEVIAEDAESKEKGNREADNSPAPL